MKTLPTFGVLPYWGSFGVAPPLPGPRPTPVLAEEILKPARSFVNYSHELLLHRPIPPLAGSLTYRDTVEAVFDRGEGRGALLRSRLEVLDGGGNPLCTNLCTTLFPTLGGFGGEPLPQAADATPDRPPDGTAEDHVSKTANLLYRLTGDTNPVHCDDGAAKSRGLDGAFVHDLCIFGFACRMGVAALLPGAPERLTKISAAMRGLVYPDTPVRLELWKTGDTSASFRLLNQKTGKAALDKGILEWRSGA
jgi:acyl dehydratase